MDLRSVTGQDADDLISISDGGKNHYLMPEVAAAWRLFQAKASDAGFNAIIVSAYRNFDRQLAIWNAKALGQRKVLDDSGSAVNMAVLSDIDKVHAIMRYTALPGASRHHWGTDIDIVDTSLMDENYSVQLTVAETCNDGVCAAFYSWLDGYQHDAEYQFKRPYSVDTGGIAVEPWHLSHRGTVAPFETALTPALVKAAISEQDLVLKATVLANFDELYERYIGVRNT